MTSRYSREPSARPWPPNIVHRTYILQILQYQYSVLASIAGLTDAEINTAVGIAQSSTNDGVSMGASNQIAVPPRPPPPLPLRSRSWSEYALLAVVVGGIGYAVVRLVRVSSYEGNYLYLSSSPTFLHPLSLPPCLPCLSPSLLSSLPSNPPPPSLPSITSYHGWRAPGYRSRKWMK